MQGFLLSARAALVLFALATPLFPGLAAAQRGVEFGYKDRIFAQKYVLPEGVTGAQLIPQRLQFEVTVGLPGVRSDPRLIEAMGGQCVVTFMREATAEAGMQSVPLTPTQAALERLPAEARVRGPSDSPDSNAQMMAPASPAETCLAQEMLFRNAFEDSLATDRQLADLAQQMRRRFAGVWMTPAQVRDPTFQVGAERARLLGLRVRRLLAIDSSKPPPDAQAPDADLVAFIGGMADTPTFEQAAAELAALEAQVLEEAQARSGKAEAGQRRQAEDRRVQEEARHAEEAAQAAERARTETEPAAPALAPQVQASLPPGPQPNPQPSPQDMARQRQEADRLAQIRQLEGRQAELDQRISRLEDHLASQQGAVLRNPLNLQGAFAGVAGISQVRAEIDQARAERQEVTQALQRLRKAAAASLANTPAQAQPLPSGDGGCRPGATCPVLALTLFCRTPQQVTAILSQRPGPGRKQVLNVLSASGDCRQVPAGQALQWTAPLIIVRPQGEAAAELVPGTLQDGTQGVMLKDGVVPRTRDAAR